MLDRWEELGIGRDNVCTGIFLMFVSVGSMGVEAVDGDSGGSPAGVKVCCSSCKSDNVRSISSGNAMDNEVARGDGLAGRDNVCLSLPKTRLGDSDSVVAATALGMLCNSISSHLVDRASSPVLGFHLSLWYIPQLLCISRCFPSNLTSLSRCQSRIGSFGSTLSVPAGQTNRNGFSGSSLSIPKSATIWESIVERS